jgi:hypothetical protein
MDQPLTPKQRDALHALAIEARDPFAFASTTVNRLVSYGYAERVRHSWRDPMGKERTRTTLHATPLGLMRLAREPAP